MKHGTAKLMGLGAAMIALTAAGWGGWVVTTVEDVPEYLVAGKPTEVSFKIRQHGMSPLDDRSPSVVLTSGKVTTTSPARYSRTTGRYSASITAPSAGPWSVTVNPDFGNQHATLLPINAVAANAPAPAAMPAAVRGKHLFVAKGCIGCHQHTAVVSKSNVGPDLTGRRFAVDYLRQFLVDPSIKPPMNPNNRMPDLELKPAEINALVAFINETKVVTK